MGSIWVCSLHIADERNQLVFNCLGFQKYGAELLSGFPQAKEQVCIEVRLTTLTDGPNPQKLLSFVKICFYILVCMCVVVFVFCFSQKLYAHRTKYK